MVDIIRGRRKIKQRVRDWDGDLHLKLYEGAKKEENKKALKKRESFGAREVLHVLHVSKKLEASTSDVYPLPRFPSPIEPALHLLPQEQMHHSK